MHKWYYSINPPVFVMNLRATKCNILCILGALWMVKDLRDSSGGKWKLTKQPGSIWTWNTSSHTVRYLHPTLPTSAHHFCLWSLHNTTLLIKLLGSVLQKKQKKQKKKKMPLRIWPRGYKKKFMLNSAEHEIFHANKSQITNNCHFLLAKSSWAWKFLC